MRGPNGQLILKAVNPGLQVQQTIVQNVVPNAQGQQTIFHQNPTPVLQQGQGQSQVQQIHSAVLNRSITPSHPSPIGSPLVSRSQTPASSPMVHSRSVTPIQTSSHVTIASSRSQGRGHQQILGNIAGSTNLNVVQIPGNTQSPLLARGIQLQGVNQVTNVSGSGVNLQGQNIQGLVQQSNQGQPFLQGQGQTLLQGQGQNIVNTQNTVIQNPNVVNLNVAHVLCNPNLQNQTGNTGVQQVAQGLQGTLIQTADGKSIIIPNQNLQAGQSINLQQLLQPQQINTNQTANTGTGLIQVIIT